MKTAKTAKKQPEPENWFELKEATDMLEAKVAMMCLLKDGLDACTEESPEKLRVIAWGLKLELDVLTQFAGDLIHEVRKAGAR